MKRRDVRKQAMQLLYQLDLRTEDEVEQILATATEGDPEDDLPCDDAVTLAQAAWQAREAADTVATEMAEDWPTRRQPPIDRSILRLAIHEMSQGLPPAVAINEAVELAKKFGAEQSPAFINGVLDKVASKRDDAPVDGPTPQPVSEPESEG